LSLALKGSSKDAAIEKMPAMATMAMPRVTKFHVLVLQPLQIVTIPTRKPVAASRNPRTRLATIKMTGGANVILDAALLR
jgi:hypothetical protein